jgi:hypothetical protein
MFVRIVEMTCDANQRDKTNEIFRNSILLKQVAKFKPHLTGAPSKKIFDMTVHEVLTGPRRPVSDFIWSGS